MLSNVKNLIAQKISYKICRSTGRLLRLLMPEIEFESNVSKTEKNSPTD